MQRIGIVAEFNPLHFGHKYLIDNAKLKGEVVCAISGNFVQRGDTALCEKRLRTKMALDCGADLVVEIARYVKREHRCCYCYVKQRFFRFAREKRY